MTSRKHILTVLLVSSLMGSSLAGEAAGGDLTYVEIAGGDHGSMVAPSTTRILEFFSKH